MGKSSSTTVGYRYKLLYHAALGIGPLDAFLEFRGGDKPAWQGELTSSGTISINAPKLWGGDKDQGGIVSDVDIMFGEEGQEPNAYLLANLGDQIPSWEGIASLVFKGGIYGSMNPYPQAAAYKIRKILNGWGRDCWYPEKAVIPSNREQTDIPYDASDWRYKVEAPGSTADYSAEDYDDSAWSTGVGGFGSGGPGAGLGVGTYIPSDVIGKAIWIRRTVTVAFAGDITVQVYHDDGATLWFNGTEIDLTTVNYYHATAVIPMALVKATNVIALRVLDGIPTGSATNIYAALAIEGVQVTLPGVLGINPAHALYYFRTHSMVGREPVAAMNDASFRAAADKLYDEGFGICVEYDPATESLAELEQRLCKLIGGSINRCLVDGQWYLDLARGEYVLEDLPILTDDDILEFSEQPTLLDGAVNSVSVKYFDPETKESIVTPPVQALGLIDAFGTIHQTVEYPEVPQAKLAARLAERDVRAFVTPTRGMDLVTTRKLYALRPNQYFRLQSPKRGIADMVCILGERQSGRLRSGAMQLKVAQDIYSLPATSYVEVEQGVDTRPSQVPTPILQQVAFEAPYIELVQRLSRADLAVLPADVGFVMTAAADPAQSRDYALTIAPAGLDYTEVANGEWCPTALTSGGSPVATIVNLSNARALAEVDVGSAALWDSEVVRVDAIDVDAGILTVGRGCADTVPQKHDPGARIWFYDADAAGDVTEYTDGELLSIKLLTNTGSAQLDPALATPMALELAARQARPYPPAGLTINGDVYPADVYSTADLAWVHRDRVAQADQLVDTTLGSIGPEAGVTYTARWYIDDVPVHEVSGITGASASYAPMSDGTLRVEVIAVRDGLASWQALAAEAIYRVSPLQPYADESGNNYADEVGNTYEG